MATNSELFKRHSEVLPSLAGSLLRPTYFNGLRRGSPCL